MLVNHRNLYHRHKAYQVVRESRDSTETILIIFSVLFYFHRGKALY